jgi:hypothetical protein
MRILPSTFQSRLTVFGGAITQYPRKKRNLLSTHPSPKSFMNSLRTFYSKFTDFSIKSSVAIGGWEVIANRVNMLTKYVITVLCAGGVAFYLRFLFALWKECGPRFTRQGRPKPPRLRLERLSEHRELPFEISRPDAALQITEIPRRTTFRTLRRDFI